MELAAVAAAALAANFRRFFELDVKKRMQQGPKVLQNQLRICWTRVRL